MAELHDLKPAKGSTQSKKRLGRGPGSGLGKTSGRGQKGDGARTGGGVGPHFEGGQMPLHRRIPKRGFNNIFRTEYQVVNVRDFADFTGEVNAETLKAKGLIGSVRRPVKVLGEGDIKAALTVRVNAFSGSARQKIEAAGGKAELLGDEQA
jgi:large subunit ribosomal protein L15